MKRCPTPLWLAVLITASVCALFAVSAMAQIQSGNIYGKVTTKDGSVLPGVTVTLSGVGAPQTFVTEANGAFRFLNLSPASYTLKAELSGYGTSTRSGIGVNIGRNADVTMVLNPSVSEAITVTAEAPLLDVRKSGQGIDVSKVELQKVPTGRDPWVIMQQTPGVLLDRINVGGNTSGQQSGYVSKGATSDQSAWNVDGVNITDIGALGSTPTYYDFDSFEEMQITTGGQDPRIQTSGIQMNMVTKRGTNDFKGSGRWFQTNHAWQDTPTPPAETKSYPASQQFRPNRIDRVEDRGFEIGGPILKDKLWFWGAFSRDNVNNLTGTLTLTGQRFLDKTLLQNENLKVNAQLLPSNSLVGTDSYGEKVKKGRNVSLTRPPETAWDQADVYSGGGTGNLGNPTIWKVEDTQIIGSSLYLTGLYSQVQGGFDLIADAGSGCTTLACSLSGPGAYLDSSGVWRRNYLSYYTVRPQKQARIDGSKFFDVGSMNHELKFGFGYRHGTVRSVSAWPGAQYTTDCGGAGCAGDGGTGGVQLLRNIDFTYGVKYADAYVGDTILMGNLTVQAAVRWDQQKGSNNGGVIAGNPTVPDLLPSVSYAGVGGLKWNNVSPRIGLTYALGANHRTLLRAGYNRYAGAMGGSDVYHASPGGVYQYLYYYFNDVNGDHVAQKNEIDFNYGLLGHGGVNVANPSAPFIQDRWAKGFKAETTDEFTAGFEHELVTDFSVGVNGTWRKLNNFSWTVPEHTQGAGDIYTPADYTAHSVLLSTACNHRPGCKSVAFLPGGATDLTLPYYTVDTVPEFFVIENRPDYSQTYKGLDLFAIKRLSHRWMLRGNLTLQDWKQHVGSGAIIDPTVQRGCNVCNNSEVVVGSGTGSGAFGGVYINSKWSYSVTGLYQIPIIETSFGLNLNGRQGYPLPYVYRISADGGFKFLQATNKVDSFRNPNVTDLDVNLAKDVRIWRGGVTFSIDVFNVLNSQTILQRDVRRVQLAVANHITETLSPRVFRLGARVNF